jgi:uncharacterized coiled-coil protein SlyX
MFNNDWDPYQKLEELTVRDAVHEHNLDTVHEQVKNLSSVLEQMAAQIQHLTNAIIGLQQMNKILHDRLTRLEFKEPD